MDEHKSIYMSVNGTSIEKAEIFGQELSDISSNIYYNIKFLSAKQDIEYLYANNSDFINSEHLKSLTEPSHLICTNLEEHFGKLRSASTCCQWRQRVSNIEGDDLPLLFSPPPLHPVFSPPLPPLPHLNLSHSLPTSPLRSIGPLNPARGPGGALLAPPAGSGTEPQPKSNLVHFSLKILHLHGGNNFNEF